MKIGWRKAVANRTKSRVRVALYLFLKVTELNVFRGMGWFVHRILCHPQIDQVVGGDEQIDSYVRG